MATLELQILKAHWLLWGFGDDKNMELMWYQVFLSFKFLNIYFCVIDCVFLLFVQIVVNSVVVF